MFDFIIRKPIVQNAQRFIDKLNPKATIHVPLDILLPAVPALKRMSLVVSKINGLESQISQFTDEQLKAKTQEFKSHYQQAIEEKRKELRTFEEEYQKAKTHEEREEFSLQLANCKKEFKDVRQSALDEILPEAFAVVREVGKRVISLRHYDVQMVGGMVLHQGKIAEMATGEGKTLVATLPAYLNAVTGEGVHVVTVNDYLARRDLEWMGPIYESLGLSVGVILHDMSPSMRKQAYACDITYGTNNEFGFDYLRDNMVGAKDEMVQHGHSFAIVDEVDSILIDEARTPLIISGPAEESTDTYYKANEISGRLKGRRITDDDEIAAKHRNEDLGRGFDYLADEKVKTISLTEEGEEKAARQFGVESLHEMDTIEYRHHIMQALRAKEFFKRDVDYVVREGQVIIVDEFTGRMMPGRRWSDGLHQAVEAKEGIRIERENQTLATITFQNLFRMYDKLAGMTGTAYTEANEFKQIYNLDCVVIPTNRPLNRANHTDCVYKTTREKYTAVVKEIEEFHRRGQPVLVGTISIEKSEIFSSLLKQKSIPHQVLNAKYHDLEAQIVAQAGRYKAVTIATNMAGRGTDIVLGGNAEFLAKTLLQQKIKEDENLDREKQQELIKKFLAQFSEQVKKEHDQVVEIGGLHVLGTERHESRRIDNQLRGRSGRQGDPGSSRFFVSLEDDLMRLFASDRIIMMMDKMGMEEDQVIEHPWVSRAIEIAQKRVENRNFEIRKHLLDYDNVMNKQREVIYNLRRNILESENVKDRIMEALEDSAQSLVERHFIPNPDAPEESTRDLEGLENHLKNIFRLDISPHKEKLAEMTQEEARELIFTGMTKAYEHREQEIPPDLLRPLEKMVLLNIIDAKWKEHLHGMDQLKEGIGLRGYGQRDPVIEYKREGFAMFGAMYASINQEVAEMIFRVEPVTAATAAVKVKSVFNSLPQKLVHNDFSSFADTAAAGPSPQAVPETRPSVPSRGEKISTPQPQHSGPKVGRNEPCPCGSGKKYKKCCGANAE